MSEENVDVVRQPLAIGPSSRRRLVERLALRFPGAVSSLTRMVLRLPPRSPLRRRMVRYFAQLLFEAANRQDWEAVFALITSPDFETITPPELVGLGFEPVYHGREGRLRFQWKWMEELGDFQQDPEEVIDCGDRLLLLVRMKGSGVSSGATFDSELAYLLTFSNGQVIREQSFRDHAEALEAAGLSE